MNYCELLRDYIKKSGLTLDEISELIPKYNQSASKQYLSKLQNGKTPPASEELNRVLAEITGGDPEALVMAAFIEKAPSEVKQLLNEGTKNRFAAQLLRKLDDYFNFYLQFGRINEDMLDSIHDISEYLDGFSIDFYLLKKDPSYSYRKIVIDLSIYLLESSPNAETSTNDEFITAADAFKLKYERDSERLSRYRAAMEGELLLDKHEDVSNKESENSLSFFGGPDKYTQDEIAEMEAALERYREMKRRAAEAAKKDIEK